MKKIKGAEVHFGDEIQLYHVRSQSYILATKGGTAQDKSSQEDTNLLLMHIMMPQLIHILVL